VNADDCLDVIESPANSLTLADLPTAVKLDLIANLRDERAVLAMDINQRIAALEAERDALTADVDAQLAELETLVKLDVTAAGATVKGSRMMAVYASGRVSWDTKRLDGYAAANSAILAFRTVGLPSVSIRVNGK
jgi:hypothetical protein